MAPNGTIVVTGANGGLGSAIVAHILKTSEIADNCTGLYTVRKAGSASQLHSMLNQAPRTHNHEVVEMDLGSIDSVKKCAADVNDRVAKGQLPPIKALILNAGYQNHTSIAMTDDKVEMTWHINYLANFLLTLLLLQSMDKQEGSILLVSSWTHDVDDPRNISPMMSAYADPKWRDIFPSAEMLASGKWSRPEEEPGPLPGQRRYGASKLCAVMHMLELNERLAKDRSLKNISVIGLDPGGMGTDLGRNGALMFRLTMKVFLPPLAWWKVRSDPNGMFRPTWKSAADVMRACFETDIPRHRFMYLNGSEEIDTAKDSHDASKRKQLWEYAVKITKMNAGDTALVEWQ